MFRWTKLVLLVCVLFILCGCGDGRRSSSTLQYWNGFTGPDGSIMDRMVQEFEKESGVKVEMQKIPWGTYFDKLISAIASGNPPDVFVLHMSELPGYADMGALMPLDELINKDDSFIPHSDRIKSIWDRGCYKGECYGVPLDIHLLGLYYNKDYFDKAGIPYPSETRPMSAEEVIKIAQKLTIDNNKDGKTDVWGLALAGEPFRNIDTLVSQFGGDTLSTDLLKSTIDSKQANDGVRWMYDLIYKHKVAPMPEGTDTWQYFLQGRVAMFTDGCWMLNGVRQLAKFNWGVAPFFTAGRKNSVWATGHVLCISRNLPKERIPNALRLIKHLNNSGLIWSTSGMVPTRYSQIRSQTVKRQKELVPFITQLDWLYFEPPSPVTIELRDRYQQTVFSSLTGLRSVDSALDRAETQMNRVLKTYYR